MRPLLAGFLLLLSGCSSISSYKMLEQANERIGEIHSAVLQLSTDQSIPEAAREQLISLLDDLTEERRWILTEMQRIEEARRNWWLNTLTMAGMFLATSGLLALLL